MPEPKEKKPRKPRTPKPTKVPGPLVLALRVAPMSEEEVAELKISIAEMGARLEKERKQLAAMKARLKRPVKVERVTAAATLRTDGIPIITAPDGRDIPLSMLSKAQVSRVFEIARSTKGV